LFWYFYCEIEFGVGVMQSCMLDCDVFRAGYFLIILLENNLIS
jgi:hypothetical protein